MPLWARAVRCPPLRLPKTGWLALVSPRNERSDWLTMSGQEHLALLAALAQDRQVHAIVADLVWATVKESPRYTRHQRAIALAEPQMGPDLDEVRAGG